MRDDLRGRTIVMSGGSRGIGLAILLAAARRGANAVLLAKTDQPDPRLPGTVHAETEAAGGTAVAVVGDVRVEADVERAVAQIVTLSPPLNMAPQWLGRFPSYMLSKYGMTLLTLGFAAEFAEHGIRANCLWPQTTIATAAVINLLGGADAAARSRTPEIMGDAAVALLADPSRPSGRTFLDVEVLAAAGVTDLAPYGGTDDPELDFFVDPA